MNKNENDIFDPEFDQWLRKNNPRNSMNVPDGYFENFADTLMSKIDQAKDEDKLKGKVLSLKSKFYLSAIAASITLLIASILLFPSPNNGVVIADIATDQTWGYVINNAAELSIEEIAEFSEIDDAIKDLEKELYGNNISEHFFDEQDIDLIEDIFQ